MNPEIKNQAFEVIQSDTQDFQEISSEILKKLVEKAEKISDGTEMHDSHGSTHGKSNSPE